MTLDLHTARRQLGAAYTLEYHQELTSTNDRALELARAGAPAGTLVVTEYQTAGRGRRGAVWTAPAGSSVMCSLVLRPTAAIPNHQLAILTGVGAAEGLATLNVPVKIKWPNDLMVHDRKVAGILVETTGDAVVVGIGVNCAIDEFPEELRERAGSLHTLLAREISRERVLTAVVQGLQGALQRVEAGGIVKVLIAWNTMNWLSRRKIRVTGPLGTVEGDGLFLDGHKLVFHVFKDCGVVPMPLASTVEVR
ncbi:MAG TPA: biotin--[acetyl-CoA-carboxylase] ligase [Armatimonadota bacterium]|jgi:BirA family biotin operon repressor/biotin-[acetyl-CoA-carboxylase] ligase